jgi:hypothetical protein
MKYEECVKKVNRFLNKDEYQPLFIDVQNGDDFSKLLNDICPVESETQEVIPVSNYCEEDEFPRIEDLFHDLQTKGHNCFVTGLSSYLRLIGEQELTAKLSEFINMSTVGHIVIITYQCSRYLSHIRDPRLSRRIGILDGKHADIPEIYFCSAKISLPKEINPVDGLNKFAACMEQADGDKLYLLTSQLKKDYPYAMYNITEISGGYDALTLMDPITKHLDEKMGTEEDWSYALAALNKYGNWADAIDNTIGDHRRLEQCISSICDMQKEQRWLYFIGLKLYGVKNNLCLGNAAINANSRHDMVTNIYRGILSISPKEADFWEFYNSRKTVLKQIGNPSAELVKFCKLVVAKEENEIYYLTDNTEKEREEIFAYLERYGRDNNQDHLRRILAKVYPDLGDYLKPYDFKNDLLNQYFDEYKYQKVVNKIFPDFYDVVCEQAKKREYNTILSPRSSEVEKLPKPKAQLYFMDAMGVEFLGFIQSVCNEMDLKINIKVCRAELPSITEMNKEFLNGWNDEQIIDVKEIDEIKHRGKSNYDYYKHSKLPIHLIKELEIIRDVLRKIKVKLINGDIDEAVMISDHGASRLVLLYDKENIWEMEEKGIHSGRCCKKSELDEQPEYAVDAGDFWVLANYDRFKGSRKIGVETHGGATLEEVCVPIITLKYTEKNIEVYIMPLNSKLDDINATPKIEVSFRKKAAIKIFITEEQTDISIEINHKRYIASPIGNGYYRVDMPDLKKKGTYNVDVYSGDNKIAEQLPLIVEREGQKVKDLL